MTITEASHIAYTEYEKHVPKGEGGTPEAAVKALAVLKPLLAQVDIDQLIDEEKEAERLAEIAASYDEAWY